MVRKRSRRRGMITGSMLLLILAGLAVAARWLSPGDPFAIAGPALISPQTSHPFGTDDLGRDVLAGVLHGASVSLAVGFAAAALSAVIGMAIGGLAGIGRGADLVLMRVTEFAQALPRFFLLILLVSLFGGRIWFVIVALGLTAWPATARLFRAQVMTLMQRDFVAASRAAGEREIGILIRHVLPLALPVLASQIAFQAGAAILAEAGLSFLGLGDPAVMSWGGQLGSAQRFIREAWWMAVFPGLAITVTVLACNLLADAAGRPRSGSASRRSWRFAIYFGLPGLASSLLHFFTTGGGPA